jgi:SPP1 family predicted phage head-tail adaptor
MRARIGRLRHRLTLEARSRANDGGWGAVEAATGKEAVAADRVTGQAAYLIIIRYRGDVTPAMRFRRGTEAFDILAVLDKDGRRRFLVCHCERRDL